MINSGARLFSPRWTEACRGGRGRSAIRVVISQQIYIFELETDWATPTSSKWRPVMKKLRMEDLRVESFLTDSPIEARGTVHAAESGMIGCTTGEGITNCMDTCQPTSPCGSCIPAYSCDYTCENNYGCSTQDQRCTHGGVYLC
jgi:hypothetical protein